MAYLYSVSPHVRSSNSTKKIMITVAISLLPCVIMGIIYFGYLALLTVATAVIFAILSEYVYKLIMGEKTKKIIADFDYTSLVTGLIIGLILPANLHLYIPALSSIFAIIVAKMLFGGTGNNFVNPAAVGRIFAFISFTVVMNAYTLPNIGAIYPVKLKAGATSLQSMLAGSNSLSTLDLFLGTGVAGCIGETCKIAIIVGAIFLAIRGIIKIWLPIIALATAGLSAVMLGGFDFNLFLPAVLSGGLMFGAFFMATDYVTSPTTTLGNVIFFAVLGVLTSILRKFTGFETASFAILIMNILVPLIDKFALRKPFGYVKPKKEGK